MLKAFTPRAAGFAAAAAAMYVAGRLTGVPELYMLAVAALALPLGALAVVTWGNSRLASSRSVRPVRTSVGNRIAVTVRLDNPTRLETGVLLLEDRLPYQLGPGARFVVPGIPGGDRELLSYEVRAAARGRYSIGPLAVRLADPFGLAQVTSELAGSTDVIVHPRVEALAAPGLGGELASSAATKVRYLFSQGDEFYTTREYRDGDDLRKVHWRSSAKRGQLMIRQDESPRQARVLIALDLRAAVHVGGDEHSSLERVISAGASIAARLATGGYEIGCVTDDGGTVRVPRGADAAGPILDFLAGAGPSHSPSLAPLAARLTATSGEGLLVLVTAVPSPEEAAALARTRASFAGALAILVRTDSWLPPARPGAGARMASEAEAATSAAIARLHRAGWQTVTLQRGEPLEPVWRNLLRGRGRAPAGGRL
ncbi:MAG: DUF58 domain-containing protein [Actinomycetes bacterium]